MRRAALLFSLAQTGHALVRTDVRRQAGELSARFEPSLQAAEADAQTLSAESDAPVELDLSRLQEQQVKVQEDLAEARRRYATLDDGDEKYQAFQLMQELQQKDERLSHLIDDVKERQARMATIHAQVQKELQRYTNAQEESHKSQLDEILSFNAQLEDKIKAAKARAAFVAEHKHSFQDISNVNDNKDDKKTTTSMDIKIDWPRAKTRMVQIEREQHDTFEAITENVSFTDMADAYMCVNSAADDSAFRKSVADTIPALRSLGAIYVEQIEARASRFMEQSALAESAALQPILADLFGDAVQLLLDHRKNVGKLAATVSANMPYQMNENVISMVSMMVPIPVSSDFDPQQIKDAPPEQLCSKVSDFLTSLNDYDDLTGVREMVNASLNMVPAVSLVAGASMTMGLTSLAEDVEALATIETLALEDATHALTSKIADVLLKRLTCDWSAGFTVRPAGLSLFLLIGSLFSLRA